MYAIGPHQFLSLGPPPHPLRSQIDLEARPGITNWGIFETGVRGEPFTMHSQVDALNSADAFAGLALYTNLVLQGTPQQLIWRGINVSAYGYGVIVLKVSPIEVRDTLTKSGGFFPTGTGWLEAEWELLPWLVTSP